MKRMCYNCEKRSVCLDGFEILGKVNPSESCKKHVFIEEAKGCSVCHLYHVCDDYCPPGSLDCHRTMVYDAVFNLKREIIKLLPKCIKRLTKEIK